jgi:hypothetical protein
MPKIGVKSEKISGVERTGGSIHPLVREKELRKKGLEL